MSDQAPSLDGAQRIAWEVPAELVVNAAPPKIRKLIYARQARVRMRQTARVFQRADRFHAILYWAEGPDLALPLDCWASETIL